VARGRRKKRRTGEPQAEGGGQDRQWPGEKDRGGGSGRRHESHGNHRKPDILPGYKKLGEFHPPLGEEGEPSASSPAVGREQRASLKTQPQPTGLARSSASWRSVITSQGKKTPRRPAQNENATQCLRPPCLSTQKKQSSQGGCGHI